MKCPHCHASIVDAFVTAPVYSDAGVHDRSRNLIAQSMLWQSQFQRCPACHNAIIFLEQHTPSRFSLMAYPVGKVMPLSPEVPIPYRQDFAEAVAVLPYSPKASAALSRRSLQMVLREKAKTKQKDLYDQIEEVIASGMIPAHISEELHAVRNIGNIAAHAMKSTNTGEIVEVEPGEAEWNLDVLQSLFDFYFIQPALSAKRKAALDAKLKDIGKPVKP